MIEMDIKYDFVESIVSLYTHSFNQRNYIDNILLVCLSVTLQNEYFLYSHITQLNLEHYKKMCFLSHFFIT